MYPFTFAVRLFSTIIRKEGKRMIGVAIKDYLDKNGIKQAFVAEKAGLTPSQMSGICNGKSSVDCVTYYRICRALNVPLDLFFEGMET